VKTSKTGIVSFSAGCNLVITALSLYSFCRVCSRNSNGFPRAERGKGGERGEENPESEGGKGKDRKSVPGNKNLRPLPCL